MSVDFAQYDFLDFGSYEGGSIDLAKRLFGARAGLGIDIDPEKIEEARQAGFECLEADITCLEVPPDSVRFVMISHLLEHLQGLDQVEATLRSAAKAASDFIFIQGPFFDADRYLASLGLKFYWSDWYGHTCHLTTWDLREILEKIGLHDHVLMVCDPVENSDYFAVHPLDSPPDQHEYDPYIHPPKKKAEFDRTLYREIICCVRLRPYESWPLVVETVKKHKNCVVLEDAVDLRFADSQSPEDVAGAEDRKIPWAVVTPNLKVLSRLREVQRRLLIDRVWNYVNYLHAREALLQTEDVKTVLFTSRNRRYLDVALALEFSDIQFYVLPPEDMPPGSGDAFRELVEVWNLDNVHQVGPGALKDRHFDLVAAMEILKGVPEDRDVIERLMRVSSRYFWLLSPFTAYKTSNNPWMGYDLQAFQKFFGDARLIDLRGAYWIDRALELKNLLESLSDEEITERFEELRDQAEEDIVAERPFAEMALGVWALVEKKG